MADGAKRHGKEPVAAAAQEPAAAEAAPAEDKFPEGMRVLAVDDDPEYKPIPTCRRILGALLGMCKYNATVVSDAVTALEMLRDGGGEQFDLVITDVHMPDMDGFKLLELIGLEMDLPVIMLSVNGEKETVLKGITHGACDYLVKPVHIKELKNIWQDVIRKNPGIVNHISSDSDEVDELVVQPVIAEGEEDGGKRKKYSKKKKRDGDDSDEDKESTRVQTTGKKPRVSWTGPLHNRFIDVVNHRGVDKAVPKTILQMMDVDYLTRECVASHLQKYRLYLKRVTEDPRKANLHGNSFERRNSCYYMNMNRQGNSGNYYEHHPGRPSSTVGLSGSNNLCPAPSMLGTHDVSVRSMNWTMGTVGHGHGMPHAVPWLPDAGRRRASEPPINSFTNISSDHTKMDAFPPAFSSKPYTGTLCEKLLEAGIVEPSSNPGNSCLAEMTNGRMLGPVNRFLVQPPELVSEFFGMVNMEPSAVSTHHEAQFPHLVGSSGNPWQHVASSSFPVHMDGAPLAQSQVSFPQIDQLQGFGASPRQMPLFHNEQENEMAGIINNNDTSVVAFSEQMTPLFDINTALVEMSSDNFSPMAQMVNGGNTSSPLPSLQTGSFVAPPTQMFNGGSIVPAFPGSSLAPPAQMVNGGSIGPALPDSSAAAPTQMLNPADASVILPVQEGPAADEQALDDQPNYTSAYFPEDIFTSMLNQDFNGDAIFGGEFQLVRSPHAA